MESPNNNFNLLNFTYFLKDWLSVVNHRPLIRIICIVTHTLSLSTRTNHPFRDGQVIWSRVYWSNWSRDGDYPTFKVGKTVVVVTTPAKRPSWWPSTLEVLVLADHSCSSKFTVVEPGPPRLSNRHSPMKTTPTIVHYWSYSSKIVGTPGNLYELILLRKLQP